MDRRSDQQVYKSKATPSSKHTIQDLLDNKSFKKSTNAQIQHKVQKNMPGASTKHVSNPRQQLEDTSQIRVIVSKGNQINQGIDQKGMHSIQGGRLSEHPVPPCQDQTHNQTSDSQHTTKSSSLSRDISPSRLTNQVVSVMSESSQSQPLLLSALTGNMPAPKILGSTSRSFLQQDLKSKQTNARDLALQGSIWTSISNDSRGSPVHREGHIQTEKKDKSVLPLTKVPFENLTRALAFKANPPVHVRGEKLQGSLLQQQQQTSVSASVEGLLSGRGSSALHTHSSAAAVPSYNQPDRRTQTPSPKAVSSPSSTHWQSMQQIPHRSPVSVSTERRISPLKVQQDLAPGVSLPLVQHGLLTGAMITNSVSTSLNSQPSLPPQASLTSRLIQLPPVSLPFSHLSSTSTTGTKNAATYAVASTPIHQSSWEKSATASVSTFNVTSVGTETEAKQYSSHAAQTGLGSRAMVRSEETSLGKSLSSTATESGQAQPAAGKVQATLGMHKKEKEVRVKHQTVSTIGSGLFSGNLPSESLFSSHVEEQCQRGISSVTTSTSSIFQAPQLTTVNSKDFTGSLSLTFVTSALDLSKGHTSTALEIKRHSPSPTPIHGNKPIPIPSFLAHSHSHVHHAQPGPRHQTHSSSIANTEMSLSNNASFAPRLQPVVTLCRLTDPSSVHSGVVKTEPDVHVTDDSASSNYQPHHRHYSYQPAQTVTSQTVETGVVVKDFIPVATSPEHHSQNRPPLPPHVNPFTFPTTGIKIHFSSGDAPSYSISRGNEAYETKTVTQKSVSDMTMIQEQAGGDLSQSSDDMPRDMPRLTRFSANSNSPDNCSNTIVSHTNLSVRNHMSGSRGQQNEQLQNPFNMRLKNLSNFPSATTAYRSAYRSHSVAVQRAKAGSITSAAKSLDILRQNVQKSINKELDAVIKKYVQKFFQPAATNIRLNNGHNAVSEEHINAVCRQIFEEAKKMFTTEVRRSATPIGDISDTISESGSINGKRVSPNPLKRLKMSDTCDSDSEKGSDSGVPKKLPKKKGRPPLHASGRSTPLKPVKFGDQVKREGPKWDPDRIKSDMLFIMGARANKALGLGNTRGRLYIRHPDVFKYTGDQDDKVWLHEQKLMPATGGKAYMLLVQDIIDLSKTDEYKDSPTLMMHECRGFRIPDWMLHKVKEQMQSLRTDRAKRSHSHSPVLDHPEPPKSLPFSTFSDTASNNDFDSIGNKNSLQTSPADTEEMDFLSAADNEDTQPSDMSPFNVASGFEDPNTPSSCQMDSMEEDPPGSAPFS